MRPQKKKARHTHHTGLYKSYVTAIKINVVGNQNFSFPFLDACNPNERNKLNVFVRISKDSILTLGKFRGVDLYGFYFSMDEWRTKEIRTSFYWHKVKVRVHFEDRSVDEMYVVILELIQVIQWDVGLINVAEYKGQRGFVWVCKTEVCVTLNAKNV